MPTISPTSSEKEFLLRSERHKTGGLTSSTGGGAESTSLVWRPKSPTSTTPQHVTLPEETAQQIERRPSTTEAQSVEAYGDEPSSEIGPSLNSIEAVHKSLMACPQALNPNAASD